MKIVLLLLILVNIFSLTMGGLIMKNEEIFDPYRRNSRIHRRISDQHIRRIFDISKENLTTSNESISIPSFETQHLPLNPDAIAPDGSLVRILLSTIGGSMAQFDLPSGMTSYPVEHRTVDEIWYFLEGEGQFWRKQKDREEIVHVNSDVCITIPVGTAFQFRTIGRKSLVAVAITMPPWPGDDEVIHVQGVWNASLDIRNNSPVMCIASLHWFVITLSIFVLLMFY